MASAATVGLPTSKSAELHTASRPALGPTSWGAHASMSFSEWVTHGRKLGVMGRGIGWWIGDWLRFGNAAYGERYAAAARMTGYDRQSLMNMVYVASRVELSRRREKLSFSHHAEVAALDPADQDAWLDRAEHDQLSVRCLREAIRTQRRAKVELEAEPAEAEVLAETVATGEPSQTAATPEAGRVETDAGEHAQAAVTPEAGRVETDAGAHAQAGASEPRDSRCPSCGHPLASEAASVS